MASSAQTYFRLSVFQDVQFQFLKYNSRPLFDAFSKSSDITSKTPNSCLGLALARSVGLALLEAVGGSDGLGLGWPERAQVKERVKE